jgi:hypothetical protein
LALMAEAKKLAPSAPVVFLTRKGTLRDAFRCVTDGAADVTCKPAPTSGDASVDALDRAMLDAAEDLGDWLQRCLPPQPRLPLGGISRFLLGLAVGLIVSAMGVALAIIARLF